MSEKSPLLAGGKGNGNVPAGDIQARITNIRQLMHGTHESRENFTYEWRMTQLNLLHNMVLDHYEEILEALYNDLGKAHMEAATYEMQPFLDDVAYLKKNLKRLMKPQDRPSPALLIPAFSKVTPMPLKGPAVLVIGPSNYPISISLQAVAGSLAAGNPTVLKPSELCKASSKVLAKYIPEYFDPSILQVVEGGIPETTALLERDWGKIHFTGSERVGKIVASAAAKTMTPTILELGGKSPLLVDETCPSNMEVVANRIVFGKIANCGQVCIAPDYLLVHKSKIDALLPALRQALEDQLGSDPEQSEMAKLVSRGHVGRALAMLKEVEERAAKDKEIQILCGGAKKCNLKTGYIAPTFILNPPLDSRVMSEELFSPILPIVVVESREQAVKIINSIPGIPLALYVFTSSDRIFTDMTTMCRSGTAVRNDSLVHFASPHLPFGGLGSSGMGTYHGEYSFHAFSHMLPSLHRPIFRGSDLNNVRCHPFTSWKNWFIFQVGCKLPDIPVLKTARRATLFAVVAWSIARFVPGADGLVQAGRLGLANGLQGVVNALRG